MIDRWSSEGVTSSLERPVVVIGRNLLETEIVDPISPQKGWESTFGALALCDFRARGGGGVLRQMGELQLRYALEDIGLNPFQLCHCRCCFHFCPNSSPSRHSATLSFLFCFQCRLSILLSFFTPPSCLFWGFNLKLCFPKNFNMFLV